MTRDRVTGLIAVILGGLIALSTSQLPASTMVGDIGPRVFPYIAAGILVFCGAGLCLTGKQPSPVYYTKAQFGRLIQIFVVALLYVLAMQYLGYSIATFSCVFVLCTMFSKNTRIRWWKRLIYAGIFTTFIYLGIVSLLKIPLPTGKLF